MRKTRSRSFPVLIMTLAFFAGLVYFICNLINNAPQWSSVPWNGHISDSDGLSNAGVITDVNGVVLARSEDGKRIYNDDENVRKACLHIVGDNSINIASAVQTMYRTELSGYSFLWGLGSPEIVKQSKDIHLTIDYRVQKAAYEALEGHRGAVFVYNYKSGDILCMVSTPAYDPYNVPEDIETNDEYEGAYINRAISASYPPGSTFKLVTGAAGLENDPNVINYEYDCTGRDKIGDNYIICYAPSGHVDFADALMYSCNAYFGKMAFTLGKDKMTEQAEKMGFNSPVVFNGIRTISSSYDVKDATDNQLGWSGVGQYTVLESPINMAIRSASIANSGVGITPQLITNSADLSPAASEKTEDRRMLSTMTADSLKKMMLRTVTNFYGSYRFTESLTVGAKTGTAEVGDGKAPHAWVTGFTEDDDCPLAFSVVVENGDSGISAAIPVASAVLTKAAEVMRND